MSAPYFAYGAIGITDSETSLESLHAQTLRNQDLAIVVDDNKIYFYQMNIGSGETHNPPYVVKPIDESNDKRWHLISQEIYTTDIIQLVGNYVQTGRIKAISGQQVQIQASNGQIVRVNTDGSVTFPSYVIMDQEPTNDAHIVNKLYVDTNIISTNDTLEAHINTRVFNIEDELKTYTDTEFETKEQELTQYLDTSISTLQDQINTYIEYSFDAKENNLELYVDTEIGVLEQDITDYVDTETQAVIDNIYPVLLFEISSWTESGGKWYSDIIHNKNKENLVVRCWNNDNIMIYPYKIESIDNNTTRIWMPVNTEILRVVIL